MLHPRYGWIPSAASIANPLMKRFWEAQERTATAARLDLRARVASALQTIGDNDSPEARLELADALDALGYFGVALKVRMAGIERGYDDSNYWWRTIYTLNEAGEYKLAKRVASQARRQFPEELEFYLADKLILPLIFDSVEEIEGARLSFAQNLDEIISEGVISAPRNTARASHAIANWRNFFLTYQARDDRSLQETYGAIVTDVINRAVPFKTNGFVNNGPRIRVGFASEHLRMHAVSRSFQGWIKYLNQDQFETRLYHFQGEGDGSRSFLADYADEYVQASSLDDLAARIVDDSLDVLIHLDVGMSPAGCLAALRLAPVQCTTWGHPVTTGLPAIDYFISGETIEPADSQHHYSETLIKLPGNGVTYDPPQSVMALNSFPRDVFGLREESTVYLCTQSTFKYLPQYDWVIAEIARQLPDSQFVFVFQNRELGKKLLKRLDRAFNARDLSVHDYVIAFPWMEYFLYTHLYALGDVFLDTIGFSSFNTAIDAITHDLPIVTCRGEFMRGRLASSVAEAVGLDALIADDAQGYVTNAVRLGRDRQFRNSMSEQIRAHRSEFFEGRQAVKALEEFLKEAVANAKSP
jgi:predicted O-linked N-acetylglucosamine transferase (SPINDLY family)